MSFCTEGGREEYGLGVGISSAGNATERPTRIGAESPPLTSERVSPMVWCMEKPKYVKLKEIKTCVTEKGPFLQEIDQ